MIPIALLDTLDGLQQMPILWLVIATIVGLCVGSFLNVVIYRLPLMMQREWQQQCREFLKLPLSTSEDLPQRFNLAVPSSYCPSCRQSLRAWQKIPLLSYLWLRGRCANCCQPIALRYLMIELVAGLIGCYAAWRYGISWEMVAGVLLGWCLLSLSVIDIDHQLLPDTMTLSWLWLGLLFSLFQIIVPSQTAIIGAIVGYLSLWSVARLFQLLTGKVGMGDGDFKLLAMLGAWLGWQVLPFIVLFASLSGALVGLSLMAVKGMQRDTPIPFGPYLALSGWLAFIWRDAVIWPQALWIV